MWYLINTLQFVVLLLWFFTLPGLVTIFILPTRLMFKFIGGAWSRWGLLVAGIRLRISGSVPDDNRSFMFLANHQSFADILVLNVALGRPLHFIAKKELSKIPILGTVLRRTDCILVARGYNKESRKTYQEAITHIKKGLDIVVFPEGTRSLTGKIGPLRKGSFVMAIDAKVDIIPVALTNVGKLWPRNNFSYRPGIVTVKIGNPIETKGYTRENVTDLMNVYLAQLNELLQ